MRLKFYTTLLILLLSAQYSFGQCSPDTTPPTITCPVNVTETCPWLVDFISPTAIDNCGFVVLQTWTLSGATIGSSPNTGINDASLEFFEAGTTTVTYYIEDDSGNSATCNFTVTITDSQAPLLICPEDLTVPNDSGTCSAIVNDFGFISAWDNCSGITLSLGPGSLPPGSEFPVGTTTNTYTFTDAVGNSSSCIFDVTVTDEENPVIICPSNISTNTTAGLCEASVTIPLVTATDNCNVVSIVNDFNGGGANASGTFPLGTTIVNYTATDSAGKIATCSIEVTVVNSQNPIISLIGANTINLEACDSYTEFGATANDNCLGDVSGNIVIDASALDINNIGSYLIYYTIYDALGNIAAQEIRTINVVDTTSPSMTLIGPNPLNIGDCSTYVELGAEAIDPCFGDISANVVIDNSSVNSGVLGSYNVTYNVLDDSNNTTSQITRVVNVIEITAPIITLIGDNPQTIEACSPYNELGATAIDPCFNIDYSGDIVIDTSALDTSTVGSYLVTYNVSDVYGNAAIELTRNIEVVDTTAPIITCPEDIIIGTDAGLCTALVNYTVTASDCSTTTVTQTDSTGLTSGDMFPLGTTTLEYTVTDFYGSSSDCSFDVTVNDTENPIALCKNISIQLDPLTGTATIDPIDIDNGSSDNCSVNMALSNSNFDCSNIGENTITLVVTDDSGNSISCDAIVTITDVSQNASVSILDSSNPICQYNSVSFTATPTDGGTTPIYQWQINGINISGETADTFTSSSLADGDLITVLMTSSLSVCTQPQVSNAILMSVSEFNEPADAGPDITNTVCSNTTVTLAGNAITAAGSSGLWTVTSVQTFGFSFSDATSPTSTFIGDVGETYTLMWSIDSQEPCLDSSDTMTITFIGCSALDFDGIDDNITFRNQYNFNSDFSIEFWMKSDVSNSNIQTLFSKREVNNLVDGYDLRLDNNKISFNWNNSQSLESPYLIITDRWYHIAVTFNNGTYTLYIDGLNVNTVTGAVLPISNSNYSIIGAMDQSLIPPHKPLNYFDGGMDEFRIWNVALTTEQIRKMMNQEIEEFSGNIKGSTVPLNIDGLNWGDLSGYYQMNQGTDLFGGDLISLSVSPINGRLRNMTTLQPETAPLPYISNANGTWTDTNTWLFGNSQAIPNSIGIDGVTAIDWNIVKSSHNISSGNNNLSLLGLLINTNTISIENANPLDGQSIRITDYLYMDGTLDLVGESQLLQDTGSIFDVNSIGVLQRDQQGTTNLYNYNYWCAPVNINGVNYSVNGVLKNGTNPSNPQNINWVSSYDALGGTDPVSLSKKWLYTYENYPLDSYADWSYKGENGLINIGLGFTMKGSGVLAPPLVGEQNYVFIGKPNNGDITTPITPDYQALVGNPYPSAIDANIFINDNSSSTLGTLYFWEHFETNATHVLQDYEGGYATYNITGGNPAVSPPEISDNGTPVKIPERYIPVAQGFFVEANGSGGTIVFNNNQRVFEKESVTGAANNGSVFFKQTNSQNQNSNSTVEELIKRIRISFKSPEGVVRHLLLGFVPNNLASDGFDYGYDALNTDDFPNDMSWMIDDEQYVIQGVGEFDVTKKYPLGIFLNTGGNIEITLEDLENFESEIDVFVYDALLDTYFKIYNQNDYEIYLENDDYLNRFYIAFMDENVLTDYSPELQQPIVKYLSKTNEIYINVPNPIEVKDVYLLNVLGQQIKTWSNKNTSFSNAFKIPVNTISEGYYIIKVETNTGTLSKKIIVKY